MSDLENTLILAFAPPKVETRHMALEVCCQACGAHLDHIYPTLGLTAEIRSYEIAYAGKSCACGKLWETRDDLVFRFSAVDPPAENHGYCLWCKQIARLDDMKHLPEGLQCAGCASLARARAEIDVEGDENGDWRLLAGAGRAEVAALPAPASDRDAGDLLFNHFAGTAAASVSEIGGDAESGVPGGESGRVIGPVVSGDGRAGDGEASGDGPEAAHVADLGSAGHVVDVAQSDGHNAPGVARGDGLLAGADRCRKDARPVARRFKTAKGDCLAILSTLADDSIDSLVTDPPSGTGIFGEEWDDFGRQTPSIRAKPTGIFKAVPGRGGRPDEVRKYRLRARESFIEFLIPRFRECMRVLKPGAFGLVWAYPRTSHWTGWALEQAGFDIWPPIWHHYSQGMPKHRSHIKPATEVWWLVRKPTSLTYEENLRQYGLGMLNTDACRIDRAKGDVPGWHLTGADGQAGYQGTGSFAIHAMSAEEIQSRCGGKGRWPADLLLSHDPRCILVGTRKVKGCPAEVIQGGKDGGGYDPGSGDGTRRTVFEGYGDENGLEEIDEFACVPGCPVRMLDAQSGITKSRKGKPRRSKRSSEHFGTTATGAEYADIGGISRCFATFHYCSKASKSEKNAGLFGVIPCAKCGQLGTTEHVDAETGETKPCLLNDHSTPKPIQLMRWLVRLVCPEEGQVLDPYMGSGSTGIACLHEGRRFLGIEADARSYAIARARLAWASDQIEKDEN